MSSEDGQVTRFALYVAPNRINPRRRGLGRLGTAQGHPQIIF